MVSRIEERFFPGFAVDASFHFTVKGRYPFRKGQPSRFEFVRILSVRLGSVSVRKCVLLEVV